ncbi:sec14 cytosolic factor-like isoform X2 [Andrographis paniculata]|uniref:sec14 cytosolic factor-like isoform X2 n=1 Tax=Andrographis paniculata TaxID=175694 RepID=UPI0021E910AB|nr:sec14 cytosolic factor-like isoform X2 [Andrographis paniculata]
MDKNQEETIAKMRESIQKLGSSSEGFEDLSLMRFLIVRSMDASKAAKMFVEWQKWRASFVPLGHIPESEIRDELDAKKVYLQGRSRNGHSLMILKVNKHFPSKDQLHFKKFMVHLMDKTIASSIRDNAIGNERSIALVDMEEMSYKNIDIRGAITGIQILKAYYPERLAKLYMINMPGFFARAWGLISRILEKSSLEKVVFVKNEEERREMIRNIGEEVLPKEYGGQAKLVLLQHFSSPLLDN